MSRLPCQGGLVAEPGAIRGRCSPGVQLHHGWRVIQHAPEAVDNLLRVVRIRQPGTA